MRLGCHLGLSAANFEGVSVGDLKAGSTFGVNRRMSLAIALFWWFGSVCSGAGGS